MELKGSDKYKYCNHHHELTEDYAIVDFGYGEFVANKAGIPLLKALNEAGLETRTHHISTDDNWSFVSILIDDVRVEIKKVNEIDAERNCHDGKTELLLSWKKSTNL